MPEAISVQEFVVEKLADFEKLLRERFASRDEARKIQAAEYERRLTELNHANDRTLERNQHFVSNDKYEAFTREFYEYKEVTNRTLILRQGETAGSDKILRAIVVIFGLILTALELVVLMKK